MKKGEVYLDTVKNEEYRITRTSATHVWIRKKYYDGCTRKDLSTKFERDNPFLQRFKKVG